MTRLEELERQIEVNILDIGLALAEIKRDKLYRPKTWEAYCEERWGWTPAWCNRRIKAAEELQRIERSFVKSDTQVPVSRPSINELAGVAPPRIEPDDPPYVPTIKDLSDPWLNIKALAMAVGSAHAHVGWKTLDRIPPNSIQDAINRVEDALESITELLEALKDEASLRSEIANEVTQGLDDLMKGGEI